MVNNVADNWRNNQTRWAEASYEKQKKLQELAAEELLLNKKVVKAQSRVTFIQEEEECKSKSILAEATGISFSKRV